MSSGYNRDTNGVPVEALQPVPGLHREFSRANTSWTTIPIEGDALIIRLKVTADCFVAVALPHYVPGVNEMRVSSDIVEQFGVGTGQVLHIRAYVATPTEPVAVKMTPMRAPS